MLPSVTHYYLQFNRGCLNASEHISIASCSQVGTCTCLRKESDRKGFVVTHYIKVNGWQFPVHILHQSTAKTSISNVWPFSMIFPALKYHRFPKEKESGEKIQADLLLHLYVGVMAHEIDVKSAKRQHACRFCETCNGQTWGYWFLYIYTCKTWSTSSTGPLMNCVWIAEITVFINIKSYFNFL